MRNITDKEIVQKIYNCASMYKELVGWNYLIIAKNKNGSYEWFQCTFNKDNFMHLLGIKSKTISAYEFYNKAIELGLTIGECNPARGQNKYTMINKISSALTLLDLRRKNAKCMKIGKKDKVTQHVDFQYAMGNSQVIGFKNFNKVGIVPVTLIPDSIEGYCTDIKRIIMVYRKPELSELYDELYMEVKEGIAMNHREDMPMELLELIK